MTFLQLVQELVIKGGMAGAGGPSSIDGQHGEYRRAVDFTRTAYEDIVNLHADWKFLWRHDEYELDAEFSAYPPPPDLHIWDASRIFLDGEPLPVVEWEDYTPEALPPGRPQFAVIQPDNQLLMVPTPVEPHVLTFDYYRTAPPMEESEGVPLIPEQYQRVILGRALMLHGNYENAEDAKLQGSEIYQMYLARLEEHQLPRRQQTHGRQESQPITVVAQ